MYLRVPIFFPKKNGKKISHQTDLANHSLSVNLVKGEVIKKKKKSNVKRRKNL